MTRPCPTCRTRSIPAHRYECRRCTVAYYVADAARWVWMRWPEAVTLAVIALALCGVAVSL